jgi:bla regulator protein blaR1
MGPRDQFQSSFSTRSLIEIAYNLKPGSGRVLAGPSWLDSDWYIVVGKIPDGLFADMQDMPAKQRGEQVHLMAQAMLADRFKLKVHFEMREMLVYNLVVKKGGPKLITAKEPPPGPSAPPLNPDIPIRLEDMRQGIRLLTKAPNNREMTVKGESVEAWTQGPFLGLDRPVVNKTGLTGRYDLTLNWVPDQLSSSGPGPSAISNASEGPSLFTALQEQLGLKLVPAKGPLEVIVIDHIERPSEN